MDRQKIRDRAIEVLRNNDLGGWTRPAPGAYPHQWLWDSCFIAIGLAHVDPVRAQAEILSLFRGQWSNGMLPNIVYGPSGRSLIPHDIWDSKVSPYAPPDIATSGMTQPPMVAEAVVKIGEQLKPNDRLEFYREVFPGLVAFHSWFYRERDPHAEGLVVLVHPWETGMDNNPAWMKEMERHLKPWWIRLIQLLRLSPLIELFRADTREAPAEERARTIELLMMYNVARRFRRKHYDSEMMLLRSHFMIEDLFLNCILIRGNEQLRHIAKELGEELPSSLKSSMARATKALEQLWDLELQQYFSRNFVTRHKLREQTLATLMPLYAGCISPKRAERLVQLLKNEHLFGLTYPVPSVPLSSEYFDPHRYWQGPTWLNTNWMITEGLRRYGYKAEADQLATSSLSLVERSGFKEYFSPIDGTGAGINNFSWTAALTIDFLAQTEK